MRKCMTWQSIAAVALAGPALLSSGDAFADPGYRPRDEQVCYKPASGPDLHRLVLDVKFHSPLNFPGGFAQSTFSVVGKHTERDYRDYNKLSMEVLHGGIIVTNKYRGYGTQSGARMGIESIGVKDWRKSIAVDCTTTYEDATPDYWQCWIQRGDEKYQVYLQKTNDELCGFFEDGAKPPY
jgi:hypothetical protein